MKITLKTLSEATAQQVFDQVAKHLLTQKRQSVLGIRCKYRGDKGMMCAAGALISDEEYTEKMEEKSWESLVDDGIVPTRHLADLITELQDIHDQYDTEFWETKLSDLALRYKLNLSGFNYD
jgi:hypothetical protein